jgi:hypothetical protein
VAAIGPCASACGAVCAAVGSALTQPLCGTEELPHAIAERIRQATGALARGASTADKREAKRAVRLAMRELRASAAVAGAAARRGQVSAACAEAVSAAAVDADAKAAGLLRVR